MTSLAITIGFLALSLHPSSCELPLENGSGRSALHSTAECGMAGLALLAGDEPPRERRPKHHAEASKREDGKHRTERAVAEGLAWLAAHQQPDGMWDRQHFDRLCPSHDRCSQTALERLDQDADVGVSALAALAFLGAGYTHQQGLYADNLSRVFSYILARQDLEGSFAAGSRMQMFNDAIATLAIAEVYGATKDEVLLEPLRRAVRHLERAQQDGGGWNYTADTTPNRNDTSVFSWVIMALTAAQATGVSPATETRFGIMDHLDWATEPDGRVRHANKGRGTHRDQNTGGRSFRYGPAMTAVGLYARSVLGLRLDDPVAMKQVRLLLDDPPSVTRLHGDPSGLHSQYYWYFGTLAMFRVGGDAWRQWNQTLRTTVLESQERPVDKNGKRGHSYGSWPAFGRGWGKWGRVGGRVYSTAINTLTLEIYYRHVPAYLSPQGLIGLVQMRQRLAELGPAGHGRVLRLAMRLHPDVGEPILLDLLTSPDAAVRLEAAIALADLGSPMGKTVLQAERAGPSSDPNAALRRRIDNALVRLAQPTKQYAYGKVTEINLQAQMLLFETESRPLYYGQRLSLVRDGRVIGTVRMQRRFSPQKAAAARIEDSITPVKKGDMVTSLQSESTR